MADGFPVVIAQRSEYCQLKRGMVSPIFIFILYCQMCNCFKWHLAIGGGNQIDLHYQLYPG